MAVAAGLGALTGMDRAIVDGIYFASTTMPYKERLSAGIVSAAKAFCTEAFTRVAGGAIQVLGGTGFTWENGMHVYLKRAKANEAAFGDPDFHRERVVQLLTGESAGGE